MNLSNVYPKTVYFCDCLKVTIVEKCKKGCSLQDLVNQINGSGNAIIYCSRCGTGKQDVVLCCANHLAMAAYTVQYHANDSVVTQMMDKSYCLNCIKLYLRTNYEKFSSKVNI